MEQQEKELCDTLKRIFTPVLLALGFVGNLMSIRIFSKAHMRSQTTFRYLTYLSLFDLAILYMGYGQTMLQVYARVDIRLLSHFMCKFHSFLVYVLSQSSSMILVCMSVDRTVSIVASEYAKRRHDRLRIAKYVLVTILFAVSLLNVHFILYARIIDFTYYSSGNAGGVNTDSAQVHTNTNDSIMMMSNVTTYYENENEHENSTLLTLDSTLYYNTNSTSSSSSSSSSSVIVVKICYGPVESFYFVYLVEIFPW